MFNHFCSLPQSMKCLHDATNIKFDEYSPNHLKQAWDYCTAHHALQYEILITKPWTIIMLISCYFRFRVRCIFSFTYHSFPIKKYVRKIALCRYKLSFHNQDISYLKKEGKKKRMCPYCNTDINKRKCIRNLILYVIIWHLKCPRNTLCAFGVNGCKHFVIHLSCSRLLNWIELSRNQYTRISGKTVILRWTHILLRLIAAIYNTWFCILVESYRLLFTSYMNVYTLDFVSNVVVVFDSQDSYQGDRIVGFLGRNCTIFPLPML